MSELDDLADELYATAPDEFTGARDALVRELRGNGDKELAKQVAALRRPTRSAWAVNLLVRARRQEVERLVALGPQFTAAQEDADADQLRALSAQRRKVVGALVTQARRLASEAGAPVSADLAYEVESSLHAAMADEGAAERVLSGRLEKPESQVGFGGGPAAQAPKTPAAKAPSRPARKPADRRSPEERAAEERAARKRAAEQALAEAREALDEAESAAGDAQQAADQTALDRDDLEEQRRSLDEQLHDVQRRLAEIELDVRRTAKAARQADQRTESARKRVTAAEQQADRNA